MGSRKAIAGGGLCVYKPADLIKFIIKIKNMKTEIKKLLSAMFLFLLIACSFSIASDINAMSIPEGAVIKTVHNPDVYIVKYKNGKQYKRLVLNPQVFESYGHLKWENILTVDQAIMNSFVVSDLVMVFGQGNIYQLIPDGDTGSNHLLVSIKGYDISSIYIINSVDFGNYVTGEVKGVYKENTNGISDNDSRKLQEIISLGKEFVKTNAKEIGDNKTFIAKIKNEMIEYLGYPLVQQSGQQLINEVNNSIFISGEMINICNEQIEEANSLLNLKKENSDRLLYLIDQFSFYVNQRSASYDKAESLIKLYLSNMESALKQELNKKNEELEGIAKVTQAVKQLSILIDETDNQLSILYDQMEEKKRETGQVNSNPWISEASRVSKIRMLNEQYNSLVEQYNGYLEIKNDLVSVAGKINAYVKYGTPLSYQDKSFLRSLGIDF